MESRDWRGVNECASTNSHQFNSYAERLDVVHGDGVAEKVEQSILKHATVAVAIVELVSLIAI